MENHQQLLNILTREGVLINVSISYWRGCKKLKPEDLGLEAAKVSDRLISLGHKRLLPRDTMQKLSLIEGRAHSLIEGNTFPFMGGLGHFLPNPKLDEVTGKLKALEDEFWAAKAEFLKSYGELRDVYLDAEHPYLRVIGTGDKEREIPIPDELLVVLGQHEATLPTLNGLFVGVERNGELVAYTPSGVFKMIQKIMRSAGIVKRRMSPHVLRHTYATRQLQAGVPIATLRMWMGHSSIATTMIYESSVIARGSVRPKL